MDANTLKKKLQKQNPLMMSPVAFALAACGGGGSGEEELTPALSGVRKLDPTGDELIDMMTTGSYYRSSSNSPVFYGLADGHFGEQWENPEEVAAVLQEVMQDYNNYADVNLVYAGHFDSPNAATEAGVGVIMSFDKFVFESEGSDDVWHNFTPSATDDQGAGIDQIAGDLYINYNASALNSTSQSVFESRLTDTDFGYAIIMHGMLATVGVKSTYLDWGEDRPPIESTIFAEDADDYSFSASNISYSSLNGDFGSTLGIADILALMYLYGPNEETNGGNDTYNLSSTDDYFVIYDTAGSDTVDFRDSNDDVLSILPAAWIVEEGLTELVNVSVGGGTIAADTPQEFEYYLIGDIENIITGSGNDTILGNDLDNVIRAGDGDDNILLSQGSDEIFGGSGADEFLVQGAEGFEHYVGEDTIIKDFEIGVDSLTVPTGSPALMYSRNAEGFATYTNDTGVYVVLEGIEANILLIASNLNPDDVSVNILGTHKEGETLTANTEVLTGNLGASVVGYQWLRDGVEIIGANSAEYQLNGLDIGSKLSVTVSYADVTGSTYEVSSMPTGEVSPLQTAPYYVDLFVDDFNDAVWANNTGSEPYTYGFLSSQTKDLWSHFELDQVRDFTNQEREIVTNAMSTWDNAVPDLHFSLADDGEQADIFFVVSDLEDGVSGRWLYNANDDGFINYALIRFNVNDEDLNYRVVALHEIGNVLGLGDIHEEADTSSIMQDPIPWDYPENQLVDFDISMINTIYNHDGPLEVIT